MTNFLPGGKSYTRMLTGKNSWRRRQHWQSLLLQILSLRLNILAGKWIQSSFRPKTRMASLSFLSRSARCPRCAILSYCKVCWQISTCYNKLELWTLNDCHQVIFTQLASSIDQICLFHFLWNNLVRAVFYVCICNGYTLENCIHGSVLSCPNYIRVVLDFRATSSSNHGERFNLGKRSLRDILKTRIKSPQNLVD